MCSFKGFDFYVERLNLEDEFRALSDELKGLLLKNLRVRSYRRHEILLHPHETCRNLYFILEGATMNFISRAGKEITTALTFEGQVAVSVESFLEKTPSIEGIVAFEDTLCCSLDYDAYNYFMNNYLDFNIFTNKMRNQFFKDMSNMSNSIRGLSALERYEFCISNKPKYVQRVPVRYLASYLGMSHETLSRMRSLV